MPEEPKAPRHRAGRSSAPKDGKSSWTHPTTWTRTRRWGTGIGAVGLVLVIALVVLLSSGGSSPTKTTVRQIATPTTEPPTTSTVSKTPPPPAAGPVCPLDGLPAPGGKVPDRPALAFKIDNYPTARPWSGIENADIIFEEPVEGFITRLVAVFQCQEASSVGPIRSAREADQGIADMLTRPILIHVGSIDQVTNLLDNSNLINIDLRYPQYAGIVTNPPGRQAPYDTYASTAAGWGLEPKDTIPPAAVFQYSDTTPAGAPPLDTMSIDFSSTSDESWTYHANTDSYTLKYADTGPALVELPNGNTAAISTTNIVVQVVNYTLGPWVENSQGGLEVMVDATGSGPLMVLRNGVFVRGTWSRASLSSPLTMTSDSGQPITLHPGTTWVDVVPSGQPVVPTP
jgi:Protein of unknown function (DUF3048) N-terminal domain/Protein of unknown function (DUF3048) C-terminal domain